jgi:hypothetical protein
MKRGFLDLLDPSNDPEFFWQVISGPPVLILVIKFVDVLRATSFRCVFGLPYNFDSSGKSMFLIKKFRQILEKLEEF